MTPATNLPDLLALMPEQTPEARSLIERAYGFAEKAHAGQERNSGEPYFSHLVAVASNLASFGMDARTVAAGLLHDVLEDTDATEESLEQEFGADIVFLVKGVTKLGKLKYRGRERHVESLRKFFIAMAEDVRVLMIKLADRLHNVSTLSHVREDKRERIARETIEVHAALAGRLGMGKLKGMLEDYAFPFAHPKEYQETAAFVAAHSGNVQETLEKVRAELEEALREVSGIEYYVLDSRVKHTWSLHQKLRRYKGDAAKIYDIVALRVQVKSVGDCYQALGVVHGLWKPMPGRIKDYIALPKPNGYQSLHTTVVTEHGVAEIQIRTEAMHREAEYGIASHLIYKEQSQKPQMGVPRKLAWINELEELRKVVSEPGSFLEELRMDFFRNRIFVFTPKGDVVDLPEDSSPIDLAYAIHSEIGDSTTSAKVNGKMAALGTKLQNGDIVELVTGKNAKPAAKWLDYAKTTLAKKRIKAYLAENGGILDKFRFKV